eukprot:scaffold20763_cov175-Amphora_coffeaeformis.AAC.3
MSAAIVINQYPRLTNTHQENKEAGTAYLRKSLVLTKRFPRLSSTLTAVMLGKLHCKTGERKYGEKMD